MTIDLLPTIAKLSGARVSKDRLIDGRDIWQLLSGKHSAQSPHEVLYFYWGGELHALRSGKWKLHLPHGYQHLEEAGSGGSPGRYVRREIGLSLFDLELDIGETTNIAEQNPEVVKRLMTMAERAREDLGDSLTGREGKNVRPAGKLGE
jgi:arylsulfatase A